MKYIKIIFYVFLIAINTFSLYSLNIYFTGDPYSSVYPCSSCPAEINSGAESLFETIKGISSKDDLLLSCGSISAGGIYDQASISLNEDILRTETYLKIINRIGYHGIVPGETDFIYGPDHLRLISDLTGKPLIISNFEYKGREPFTIPYLIENRSGKKIFVAGIISKEFEYLNNENTNTFKITDYKECLRKISEGSFGFDLKILLTSLFPKELESINKELIQLGFNIIIASGPRLDNRKWVKEDGFYIARTEFLARRIAKINISGNTYKFEELLLKTPSKKTNISDLIDEFDVHRKKLEYKANIELYRMPLCPYSTEAEKILFNLSNEYSFIKLEIFNVFNNENGNISFLHGERERELAFAEECVKRYYPHRYRDFINGEKLLVEGESPFERFDNVDIQRLKLCLESKEAETLFLKNQKSVLTRGVNASPVIYINNKKYNGPLTIDRIKNAIADSAINSGYIPPEKWKSEECYSDTDCFSLGKISICKNGKCIHLEPVPYKCTVIYSDTLFDDQVKRLSKSILSIHPGGDFEYLSVNMEKGKNLLNKYQIKKLPAFLFSKDIRDTHRFSSVKEAFMRKKDIYILNPQHYFPEYFIERITDESVLFVSPLSENGLKILKKFYGAIPFKLSFTIYKNKKGFLTSARGVAEIEESMRLLAIYKKWRDKFPDYVNLRSQNTETTYWEDFVINAGIDPIELKKVCFEDSFEKELELSIKLGDYYEIKNENVFVYEGHEKIVLTSEASVLSVIERINKTKIEKKQIENKLPLRDYLKNAIKYVYYQCDLGARVPQSKAHKKLRHYIRNKMRSWGYIVEEQVFNADHGSASGITFYNIIASNKEIKKPYFLLGAHYDCRPFCEKDPDPEKRMTPLMGANDGASGVAVLLALAEKWSHEKRNYPVKFIFFDGEDWGLGEQNMFYGSKYHSQSIVDSGEIKDISGMILLDMIGDKDLEIGIERSSLITGRELFNQIMDCAELVNAKSFKRVYKSPVLDDHVFYARKNIPAIDIIDFDYPYWHTTKDTPDKVSSESLEEVGRVVNKFFETIGH